MKIELDIRKRESPARGEFFILTATNLDNQTRKCFEAPIIEKGLKSAWMSCYGMVAHAIASLVEPDQIPSYAYDPATGEFRLAENNR